MTVDLKSIFAELAGYYTGDELLIARLWEEIEKRYGEKQRYYHTLAHIESMLKQLADHKNKINDWRTILFSVYYHDIVYNVLKNDNEEKSALIATKSLDMVGYPALQKEECVQQILATKAHKSSDNPDTNMLIDADLSILGATTAEYQRYCSQIRQEYALYPDIIYKPGRRKVLNHFLQQERIFKTDLFYHQYELQARKNLTHELEQLS